MSDMGDEILELSARRPRPGTWGRAGSPGRRYVRTPEGAEKYGLPIGSPITADAIARAKSRGRSYTVPEDDARFGSKAPVAGRQRRNAGEIVTAIRNAPAPRVVTPDGPKKIAVGDKGFSFPEGSRAFRSQKHQNFAIVRTPDYQLVGITDRGIAFELDGDLERELNAELDDDLSEIWIPDEPNPNLGSAGAPDGAEGADGPEVDAFRPDNLEDMPGYLSDERIDEILSGLEQAGVDQNARNATELQLRRNNDRIREEFESVEAPGGPDGTEEDAAPTPPPVPDKPADEAERIRSERAAERMETAPQPTPDRQPEPEAAETPKKSPSARRDGKVGQHADNIERRRTSADSGSADATDDEQLATLEELTRSRPTGVAEGEVNGKRVAVRRNRVNDAMEYSAEDEAFPDRDSLLENTRKRNAPEEPRDTTDMEPGELSDQELDDVLADIDDALRAGMISRREARARRTALAAERNRRTGDAPDEPEEPAEPEVAEGTVQPGEPTTREWAEAAQPGAAAQTSDGVLAQRTDDGWETPLGRVQDDFLGESDVIDDDTVVVRNEPEADGRPVGATRQLTTIEDFEDVRPLDGVVYMDAQGNQITGVRRADGRFDLTLPDGLQIPRVVPEALLGGGDSSTAWHVPNQDFAGAQSRETWNVGNTLESLDDLAAQRNGTRLRYRFRRPGTNGRGESSYTVLPGGRVRHDDAGTVLPGTSIKPAILQGRVSVAEVPTRDIPDSEIDPPRVVENIGDYVNGDTISDYRHLRDMAPGTRVTLVVPASQNGGREAQVVLTRTRDEADLGGFMFLVGNGGRGYNSFGENNASLFQAIYEGRLHFGDIKQLPDAGPGRRIGGDWSRERDIDLWEGGPQVSEYDLRTFIASQVASTAMQGSYYDTSLLPDDSPFRSRQLRDEFSRRAIEQYSVEGNPARHKPAMIRLAAEKLGMQYTEPGSTLLPDNLTLEDFSTRVTLGRWLRSTGTSAEANMGPEQIEVTRADIKTALAVLDNMQVADSQGDPDKILKRVFARQGSPLQDLNVAVAIASYFRMKRFKDGQNRPMTTIARQYDKRRNRELLRQMLREQLEGREPGYYGVPEDEVYERNGVTYTNRSTLSRPQTNARNDENPNAVPAPTAGVDTDRLDRLVESARLAPFTATGGTANQRSRGVVNGQMVDVNIRGSEVRYSVSSAGDRLLNREDAEGVLSGSLRPEDTTHRNFGSETPEPEVSAGSEPGMFDMTQQRRDELDDFDNVRDAYLDARSQNDVLNYIQSVMGEDGVSALNDGTITMRQQFTDAWNQSNGVSPDAPEPETPSAPEVSAPRRGETVDAARIEELPVGSVILYPRRSGGTSRYTRRAEGWSTERGNLLRDNPATWNARFTVESTPEEPAQSTPAVSSTPRTAENTTGDPRFAQGGAFTGSEIRQAPVGAHVRGASGREYRVTENGLQALGENGQFLEFPVVERFNANFTYVGDSAPDEPVSAVAQTAPDPRIGSTFDTTELLSLPRGTYVSSSGGTVWQLHGSYMTSTASGVRRRIRNLRSGRYRFLGNSPGVTPTRASGTPARPSRPIAEAGLSRVPQDVITRYDTPRAMPSVRFDTTDTTPWVEMTTTPDGRERLNEGLRQALLGALPEGSEVSVAAGPGMFSASYTTPDGQQGSMSRTLHGNGRIENSVARAGGANFAAVQDHLFAFYRQHGLTEVEVHGLSSNNWNGAHTWIRRGFRPDPEREGANFMAFARLRDNLSRIINRTEAGEFPAYVEFLDEAKDLARRMTELLNERQNLTIDERNERLYQLWRELTYLAEVRDASGATARGQRQSIGWRLLGNRSSETWYYGLRSLNDYFQN